MIQQANTVQQNIYYQMNTLNTSFVETHLFLQDFGIQNNKFFLILLDPDLAGVDPIDPKLNSYMKQKIARECMSNYWYFLREIVRIPEQGGSANSGKRYQLHRGNLALNFCLMFNWNVFAEFPRQHGKTIAVVIRVLWEFLFGTTNSEMMLINKKHDDSKLNLQRLKDIREALPTYLQMAAVYGRDGKKIKAKANVESLEHPTNGNKIQTLSSANNKVKANSLGRGCTQPRQWYDEYAFIPYNNIVYLSATPAFKTASMNAKKNNAPYGIIITTTPGDLTTDEGLSAFHSKEAATPFSEKWYDMKIEQLEELKSKNTKSSFVYIRFTYQQLGSSEQWFREIVIDMEQKWADIRREVLLEWSNASDNSPFSKEDLNIVKSLIKEPIKTLGLCNNMYQMNIYENLTPNNPPLIGVDVSGGYKRDSSAVTVVDSATTRVCADLNCNYINTHDLARALYELVTKYMSNAVVNIERNGGFGSSVISKLLTTNIKKNLFYEIKDRVVEERFNGMRTVKQTQRTKVYGLDSTKNVRETLIDILRQRMEYHKDKFVSPIIFNELQTLEVKKNGRVEHSSNGHDDQIFSYLIALYIWYEGSDVMERWNIQKKTIKTDEDLDEAIIPLEDKFDDTPVEIEKFYDHPDDDPTQLGEQLNYLSSDKTIPYEAFIIDQQNKDQEALNKLLQHKLGQEAYINKYNVDKEMFRNSGQFEMPPETFSQFYA